MRSKIKEINTRLQESVTQKNYLELRYYDGGRTKTARLPTTSLVNEGHLHSESAILVSQTPEPLQKLYFCSSLPHIQAVGKLDRRLEHQMPESAILVS
ncbi:hypothetical protein CFP56_010281 [Quercus suber]|uniref:Uncharacterized protein n=1 Tax=Quercus suber TaxID=58331 RepID=A0AAW0L0U1_QUESU